MNVKERVICLTILSNIMGIHCGQKISKFEPIIIEDCNLPASVYEARPIKHFARIGTVRTRQTYQLNFTISEKTLPVIHSIRSYKMRQQKKKLQYTVANLTCTNPIVAVVRKMTHLKYDNQCCLLPGVIVVDYVKMEDIFKDQPSIRKIWDIGQLFYDVEFATRRGVLFCLHVGMDIA